MESMAKRLIWVRETLGLSISQVCSENNITPVNRYYRKEYGLLTENYEEISQIARYYDLKWQRKYLLKNNYPTIEGNKIEMVTPLWLMTGKDHVLIQLTAEMRLLRVNFERRESEYVKQIKALTIRTTNSCLN